MLSDPRFSKVAEKFYELTAAQPYGGASLAIFKNGEPVLDIWAGEARPGVPWNEKQSRSSSRLLKGFFQSSAID